MLKLTSMLTVMLFLSGISFAQHVKDNNGRSQLIRTFDGKLIYLSATAGAFYTECLYPGGEPDDTYKGALTAKRHLTKLEHPHANSISTDKWGRIHIAGSIGKDITNPVMVRLLRNGVIDSEFNAGIWKLPSSYSGELWLVDALNDGKTMVYRDGQPGLFAHRFTYDGRLDTTYASSGVRSLGDAKMRVTASLRQANRWLYFAGSSEKEGKLYWCLDKVVNEGDLDVSFGDSGQVSIPVGACNEQSLHAVVNNSVDNKAQAICDGPSAIVVSNDSSVYLAGLSSKSEIAILKLTKQGNIDERYGASGWCRLQVPLNVRIDDITVAANGSVMISGIAKKQGEVNWTEVMLLCIDSTGRWQKDYGLGSLVNGQDYKIDKGASLVSFKTIQMPGEEKLLGLIETSSTEMAETNLTLIGFLPDLHLGIVDVPDKKVKLNIYPKKLNKKFKLHFELIEDELVTVDLLDVNGKMITTLVKDKSYLEGENEMDCDLSQLKVERECYIRLTIKGYQPIMLKIKI